MTALLRLRAIGAASPEQRGVWETQVPPLGTENRLRRAQSIPVLAPFLALIAPGILVVRRAEHGKASPQFALRIMAGAGTIMVQIAVLDVLDYRLGMPGPVLWMLAGRRGPAPPRKRQRPADESATTTQRPAHAPAMGARTRDGARAA